jgi:predicted DNA-binding protein
MTVTAKNAKDLLAKYQSKDKQTKKRNLSISIDVERFEKLTYLSKQTNTSKNEIITNALINFGIDDIEIPPKNNN